MKRKDLPNAVVKADLVSSKVGELDIVDGYETEVIMRAQFGTTQLMSMESEDFA
jgi:hypothetical protein